MEDAGWQRRLKTSDYLCRLRFTLEIRGKYYYYFSERKESRLVILYYVY